MVWKKEGDTKWTLYINGEVAGYVVLVKFKNGTTNYQGIAMYKKTRSVSPGITSSSLTKVKAAVERYAKAQRKK